MTIYSMTYCPYKGSDFDCVLHETRAGAMAHAREYMKTGVVYKLVFNDEREVTWDSDVEIISVRAIDLRR